MSALYNNNVIDILKGTAEGVRVMLFDLVLIEKIGLQKQLQVKHGC